MKASSILWKVQYAGADTFGNPGTFAAALRQHLRYTPTGLRSVLQQIGQEQSAYLIQPGCAGCAHDRCAPGCRVELLRRVLRVGYAESQLTPVRRGLVERPYTRMVIGWPTVHAKPLDASVLQGWQDARIEVRWRGRGGTGEGLRASVVLKVGDGADDPRERLDAVGWRGVDVSSLLPLFRKHSMPVLRLWEGSWPHDPYLLTPVAAATHWLMSPPGRSTSTGASEHAAGYGNAATIVHHLHEAGGRVEMLDLDEAGWTAQVAATTAAGAHPRPVFEALRAPGTPLEVCDSETGTLTLDPSQARPHAATPPLLFVGVRPTGPRRWRPLSATHHLVLSGPIEAGVILGMLGPAVESHGVRSGVLDLTENGAIAAALIDLPGRLPTADGRNPSELLGAIGSLSDPEQLVVVVVAVEDAAAAEGAMLPFLRAALYRPISVLLVVPATEAIPAAIQHRCPLVEVRQRVARWQVPEGRWSWARPTVLRLPWRDPQQSWSAFPRHGSRHRTPLPLLDGFWAVPSELQATLGGTSPHVVSDGAEAGPNTVAPDGSQSAPAAERAPGAAEQAPTAATMPEQPLGRQRRSRVYSLPVDLSTAAPSTAPSPAAGADGETEQPEQASPMPSAPGQPRATAAPQPATGSRRIPPPAPLPRLPGPAPVPEQTVYTPQEDSAGNLLVDQRLLLLALRWAEQLDQDDRGVPMTRFKSALRLPSKAHSVQLVEALRLHGLIRREVRDGWYELLTVEAAVEAGKLPPGPWYTPQPADHASTTASAVEPDRDGEAQDVTGAPSPEAHVNAPPVVESEVVA